MSTSTYETINAKDKPIAEDFVYVYSEIEDGGFRKVSKAMLKVLLGVATKLSELENDKEFITKTVSDLENYYLKSETYSKDEIDNRISLIPRFNVQVVSSLPTTDISETTVYLVSSGDDSDNLYTEYINVNGLWEILGTQKIASVENAVLYTAQSLTDEEKTQARTNIGAISSEDIPKSLPASDVYSWAKEPEKPSYTASEVGALPDTTKIPTNTSDLTNDSGYITKTVNDLANYYSKSQTYSAEEIDNKLSAIPKFSIEPVEQLPTSNISATTVYLLKSGEETDNLYTEYIRVNGKWEYLGKQTVDLTGYVKRTELSSYYTKTEIDSLLETIRNSIPSLIGYAKESYVQEYAQPKGDYATNEKVSQLEEQIADHKTQIDNKEASGTATAKVSEHNTSEASHNDIRLLINGLTTRLNALANSDDTTLDQMAEVVAYIKNNKSLIDGITTSKVNVSDIIDNLTTSVSNKPLSAKQGVALKALIDAIVVPTKVSQLTNDKGYLTSHQDISGKADKSNAETWTFTLEDGSIVTKKVVLA